MRNVLLTVFSAICIAVHAQEKTAAEYIGWKGTKVELHTISNKDIACTLVMNDDSVRVFQLNAAGQLADLFSIPRLTDEKFLGGFFKENKMYLFSNYEKASGINSLSYDFNSKTVKRYSFPFTLEKELEICNLSSENYFCFFTVRKKSPDLVLYKFSDASKLDTLIFRASSTIKADLMSNAGRPTAAPKIDVEKVEMAGECDLEVAKCQHKIYVRNDTMLMLLNNKKAETDVYSFDLKNNRMDNRTIRHTPDGDTALRVENSFLFQNKLLYAYASWDSLFIQITDLYTGSILNSFRVYKDEDIAFKNTPLIQDGSTLVDNPRILGKNKQLLRKAMNGALAISASPEGNNLRVLVGSIKSGHYLGDNLLITPGIGPGGGVSVLYIPVGGFSSGSWVKSAHFGMLLNKNAQFVEGNMPLSINDRIDKYNRNIGFPAERENLIMLNGEHFYIFYTKKRKALEVVRF